MQHRCRCSFFPKRFLLSACTSGTLWLVLIGCGQTGLKTHSLAGKVEVKDGDTSLLTGSHVELLQEADETIRPSGKLSSSGSFTLQTLHGGKLLLGVPAGKYKVRIVLGDESDEGVPKRKSDPINKKYYDFASSGLTVTVPGSDCNFLLSKK